MLPNSLTPSQNLPQQPMSSLNTSLVPDEDELCIVCDGECTCHKPQHRPVLKIKLPPPPKQQPPTLPKRRGRPPKNPNAPPASRRPKQPPKKPAQKKKPLKRKRVETSSESDLTDVDTNDDDDEPQFPTFVPASAIPYIASNSSASEDSEDSSSSSGFDTDSSIEEEEENYILAEEERARVRRELFGDESLFKRRDNRNDNWVIHPRKTSVGASSDVDMDVDDSDATEDDDEDDDDEEEEEDDEDDEDGAGSSAAGPSHTYSGLATSWSDNDDQESSFDADLFFANLSDSERTTTDSDSGSTTQSDDATQDGDQSDLEGIAASIIPHLRQQGLINLPFEVAEGWDGQVVFTNGIAESGFGYLDAPDFDVTAPPEMSASPSADGDVDMLSTDADEEGYEQDVDLDTAEGEGDGDTTDEDLVGDDDLPNERAMRLFNTPFSFSNLSSINPLSTMSPVATARRRNNSIDSSFDSPRPADILAGRISNVIWEDEAEAHDHSDEHIEIEDSFEKERRERDRARRGGMPRSGVFEVETSMDGSKACQAIIDDQRKDVPSPHPPRFKGGIGHGVFGMARHKMSSSISSGFDSLLRRSLNTTPLRPSSLPPPSTRLSSDLPVSAYNSDVPLAFTSPEPGNVSPPTQPIDLSDVLDPSFLAAADQFNDESSLPPPDTPTQSLADMSSTDTEDQVNQRYMRNLDRWDLISVGAFRKTREAIVVGSPGPGRDYVSDVPGTPGGWSDSAPGPSGNFDYGYGYGRYKNVLRASPLSTMLWHNKNGQKLQQMQRSEQGVFSPELLPVGSRDGDRTPTNAQHPSGSGSGLQPAFSAKSSKSKKEMKKERKLKRKSGAGIHDRHTSQQQQRHQHHHTTKMRQHHSHGHYGNMKSRSMGSAQRTNFFSSSVPSLSI
ncbi:hypothetical protein VKT23_014863 [Stygiomarasmius scandens]|uniref:Uncharacterized protein n=1 Tax=Marasmiellus scandens TaxID=2682957 RepID=A0ABR1IZA3_9AGAR